MTLEGRQQCDGCGMIRTFSIEQLRRFKVVIDAAAEGGWVEVQDGKHLCPHCIKNVLKK